MKKAIIILSILLFCSSLYAQKTAPAQETPVPCNGDADGLPGKYTDHTNPKYPSSLKGPAPDKAAMTKQLIAFEKLEEASRANFQLTGCVARVSFSGGDKNTYINIVRNGYDYQLGVYQNVCHVTQHIVKTVGEYRTVLRVNVNPYLIADGLRGAGEFYLTDRSVRYQLPIDAKEGPDYEKDKKTNPSHISQYFSEGTLLTGRSNDYKNKHADFLKLNNGSGYVENFMSGSRDDKPNPKGYKWIDRHYLITKQGVPLLIPVTRKQYLEDLLEYFEIEKANFYYSLNELIKRNAGNTSDNAQKRAAVLEADKTAYPKLYEDKKAKVKQLLATQKEEWLQKQAVVAANNITYDAYERLNEIGKFYDKEDEYRIALNVLNPAYFKTNTTQPSTSPILIEVQFRYEIGGDRGFSERLFNNFLKNYDLESLKKMLN
ncbi:hypothetical protein [Pedobacter steynii]